MMGRNHIIVGACALEHMYLATVLIDRAGYAPLKAVQLEVENYTGTINLPMDSVLATVGMCMLFLFAYFIGCLLPDIDDPDSLLGRMIHVPVEHRTWLHAIYLYIGIGALGFICPVFSWVFIGAITHLFWDSPSACGNCWFYKLFSDYRTYPSGAKFKKGHYLTLYRAGEWSEYLLVFIIVAASVAGYIIIMR